MVGWFKDTQSECNHGGLECFDVRIEDMGGHALKINPHRMSREEYEHVSRFVLAHLFQIAPSVRADVLPSYFNKKSFGDVDVLVSTDVKSSESEVLRSLNPSEVVRNGPTVSLGLPFDFGTVQVDLLYTPNESYDFAMGYLGFNDLGNLLGRVAHKANFKLGHLGLMYVMRASNVESRVVAELTVTRDWDAAIELFGYDPALYRLNAQDGFRDFDDIFRFTMSSPYAYPELYLLENQSHSSRTRDRKRPAYQQFLRWLNDISLYTERGPWEDPEEVRVTLLQSARNRFPDFNDEYLAAIELERMQTVARTKFNGLIVSERTGLTGPALGQVMREIRDLFETRAQMLAWLQDASTLDIDHLIDRVMPERSVAL